MVKSTNKIVSIAPKSDNVSLNSLEGFTLVKYNIGYVWECAGV